SPRLSLSCSSRRLHPASPPCPYTTLFRSARGHRPWQTAPALRPAATGPLPAAAGSVEVAGHVDRPARGPELLDRRGGERAVVEGVEHGRGEAVGPVGRGGAGVRGDGTGRELAGVE